MRTKTKAAAAAAARAATRAKEGTAKAGSARRLGVAAALAAAALASACGSLAPGALATGTPIAQARRALGGPTGEYALPGGGTRLEFARGVWGRRTDMLDFDAAGRLVASSQVLTEANFAAVRPGMTSDEVLMRIGHPAERFGVARPPSTIWNYRYFSGDCVWFQVGIDPAGRVIESNYAQDPACDPGGAHE
ncbi:hypothetical protein [Piscinibacter koreensis]|uniref:Beta-barrel assembly machine subunit BamE n=1 Tax=Piscinibacter koreensis TaxID=2742824 RepID=A0A7Y6NL64_9BURK|nr:hypothetical protein [Schlegelella koreensis]NUZ05245.1 hypothetical protein [Schlegelella koreensis]